MTDVLDKHEWVLNNCPTGCFDPDRWNAGCWGCEEMYDEYDLPVPCKVSQKENKAIRTKMQRSDVLHAAIESVDGSREQYGDPEDNFKTIANLWNAYLGESLVDEKDVCNMMVLLKVARAKVNFKADNYIDMAGYAACACEIESGEYGN